ncbi:MAG: AAA family ATPase [Phycisphaeraceae bacterium]
MKSLVLFNNKGGVGKTTLTFNIAHMMTRKGLRVVVVDYDPQCNITAIFLDEDELTELWADDEQSTGITVSHCIDLVRRGKGDVREPVLREVSDNLWLLPGHLSLSRFEQTLAEEWAKTAGQNNERPLDVTTSLDLLSNLAAEQVGADVMLFDVGPSLGALNRSAILACDAVVIPVAPDLFSLQGLRNVGPTLRQWREDWNIIRQTRMTGRPQAELPPHNFEPIGYLVQQHLARVDRPVKAYKDWAVKVPEEFHRNVLDENPAPQYTIEDDPQCIATIKHFASLVPFAQTARKPMFDLKQADGVGGGQIQAVAKCRRDFEQLTNAIYQRLTNV